MELLKLFFKPLSNPLKAYNYTRQKFRRLAYSANNIYFKKKNARGEKICNKDWDNLVILDACRYDYFVEVNSDDMIPGELSKYVSRGSHSREFIEENFHNEELHDTVYITTNPYANNIPEDVFYKVELLIHEWDETSGTVPPEAVVKSAIRAHDDHPNKRLIIHFIQPHAPFLGPTANRIRGEFSIKGYDINLERDVDDRRTGVSWKSLVKNNKITKETFRNSYKETLEVTLPEIKRLLSELNGKSVITSDHGEMLFERVTPITHPEPHHPYNVHTKQLCFVPWHEVPYHSRRTVKSETPLESADIEQAKIDEILRSLGYK
jgi:hypothetical protein